MLWLSPLWHWCHVSGRETFGKEGLIFRQNCELFVDCSFWQKVKRSANFQGKLLSDVSKRVQWAQVGKSVRVWLSQRRKQHCLLLCCCSRVEELLLVLLPDFRSLGKRSQWPVGRAAGERSQESWVSCVLSGSILGYSHKPHTEELWFSQFLTFTFLNRKYYGLFPSLQMGTQVYIDHLTSASKPAILASQKKWIFSW